jgi:aldose 1-epimerase
VEYSIETVNLPVHNFNSEKEVKIIEVKNDSGISFKVSSFGAGLLELFTPDKHGKPGNIIHRFKNIEDNWSEHHNCYMGVTMGRFSRCIEKGEFSINEKQFKLSCNENGHHFHGGTVGFDKYNWKSSIEKRLNVIRVIFAHTSTDGDQGYPGNVNLTASYILDSKGRFSIKYEAFSDKDTLLSLSNHAFWNLAPGNSINDHYLQIPSKKYIPTDASFIPDELPKSVEGTPLDFSHLKKINNTRIDNCFVLDNDQPIVYYEKHTGRQITIETNQKVLAVYTGDHLSMARAGITFQSGAYPNAPNYMRQASSILKANEHYKHEFKVTFSIK